MRGAPCERGYPALGHRAACDRGEARRAKRDEGERSSPYLSGGQVLAGTWFETAGIERRYFTIENTS